MVIDKIHAYLRIGIVPGCPNWVNYQGPVTALIATVQELQARVEAETLEAELQERK